MEEKDVGISLKFRQDFKFIDLVSIGVGSMTGATIYIMAGQATQLAGTGILLALIFNFFLTILTGMTYAELSTVYPEAGGGYLFVEESLPKPFGFMGGWMSWFAHSIADAFYTVVFATALMWLIDAYVVLPFNQVIFQKLIILAIIITIIMINYWGTATTGRLQTLLTNLQILLLIIVILVGVVAIIRHPDITGNLLPFNTSPMGILLTMGLLFVGFEGYEIIAQGAEEIKNPEKNIPKAIFYSLIIVTVIYFILFFVMLSNAGTAWVGSQGEYALINYGGLMMGSFGSVLVILAMLLGSGATLNATVYSAIRVSFAMGRNGSLPKILSKMHKKHRTPHIATLVTGVIIGGMALFLPLDTIVAAASIMFLLLFTLVNIAVIINRYRHPHVKRAYKIPLFPFIPILAIITKLMVAFVLWIFSPEAWYIALLWIEVGLLIYYFWAGKREIEKPQPIVKKEEVKLENKNNILVPLVEEFPSSVKLGGIIAKNLNSHLYLLSAVEVPLTVPPQSITYEESSDRIKMMERMEKIAKKYKRSPSVIITVSHDPVNAIRDEVKEKNINLILLTWRQKRGKRLIFGSTLEKIYRDPPCDIIIFRDGLPDVINEVTIIVSKRKSSDFSFRIAMVLAKEWQSRLKIIEFTYNGEISVSAEKYVEMAAENGIDTKVKAFKEDRILTKIIEISKSAELLIIAPPSEYLGGKIPPTADPKIVGRMKGPIILVRKVIEDKDMSELSMLIHG